MDSSMFVLIGYLFIYRLYVVIVLGQYCWYSDIHYICFSQVVWS